MATYVNAPGVTYCTARGQWLAQIRRMGFKINLGRFRRKRDAQDAYRKARVDKAEEDRKRRDEAPKHKPAPRPVRKSKRAKGSQEPRYDALLITQALHGYVILQLEARHVRARWAVFAIRWLEEALALGDDELDELLRAAAACIKAEQHAPSTDYQCELELATEAALDALFVAAKCGPLFAATDGDLP